MDMRQLTRDVRVPMYVLLVLVVAAVSCVVCCYYDRIVAFVSRETMKTETGHPINVYNPRKMSSSQYAGAGPTCTVNTMGQCVGNSLYPVKIF